MSGSTSGTHEGSSGGAGRWRLLQVTAPLFFVAGIVQIFLGGYGVFAAKSEPLSSTAHLDAHRTLGNILAALAVLVLIGAILTRSRKYIIGGVVLLVLTGVMGVLASNATSHPALGGLHVVFALVIVGAAGWLSHGAFRGAAARGVSAAS